MRRIGDRIASGSGLAPRGPGPRIALQVAASPCPLCSGRRAAPLSGRDGKTGEPLAVVVCARCGHARQDPLPDAGELADWYREHYRLAYKGVAAPKRRHVWRAAGLALDRFASVAPWLAPGARTLDVGAGGGEFVALMARRGFRARGIEPNRGYAEFARDAHGIDVVDGALEDLADDGTRWDAITMFHVLEHVADPVAALGVLRARLAPGGVLVVEVPNVECVRGAPSNLFFRAHVHYFSAGTLLLAAARAGLGPVSARPDPRGPWLRVALRADPSAAAAVAPPGDPSRPACRLAERALRANAMRTWRRYLLSPRAPDRLAARWRQLREERDVERRFGDARAVLDARYGRAHTEPRPAARAA